MKITIKKLLFDLIYSNNKYIEFIPTFQSTINTLISEITGFKNQNNPKSTCKTGS